MTEECQVNCGEVLDIAAIADFHVQLKEAFNAGNSIVLDAADLQRVDGAGLQVLVALFTDAPLHDVNVSWHSTSSALINSARLMGLSHQLKLNINA